MISLIICTYKRPEAISSLLNSILKCSKKPDEILVIDASPDDQTMIKVRQFNANEIEIKYYLVQDEDRGLTKQRNFGVAHVNKSTDYLAFLDDDIIVEPDYFQKLTETYALFPEAIGVGGIDLKANEYFKKKPELRYNSFRYYELDGWVIKEPARYIIRKIFGLMPTLRPGLIPEYSHGRSSLPPSGEIYEVEHFMGGISSYRKDLFNNIKFSEYFTGYGLYEDFDFCVRALPYGKLCVNTSAKVWHYHESSGRPDFYRYGKMVVQNGWYVWRQRFPNPSFTARLKWNLVTVLLIKIRFLNILTGPDRKKAFYEFCGRLVSWFKLFFNKPGIIR